jgi:hypothetical protein
MTNSQRLAAVRRCLDRWLEAQHRDEDIDIRDAVLIRGGFYVGRKFELGAYRANWFMEEDELKIHDATGAVVAKFSSSEIDQASKSFVAARETKENATAVDSVDPVESVVPTIRMQRTPSLSEPSNVGERPDTATIPASTVSQPVRRAA